MNVAGTSNLTTLFAPNANVSTLNVSSISIPGSTPTTGYVLSTTGGGLAWVASGGGGGGGSSQWSNILVAGNQNLIYYVNQVGIGSNAPPSANLMVTGNIYTSNAIQTTNVIAAGFTSNSTNTNFLYDTLTVPNLNVTGTLTVAGLSAGGQVSAIGNTVSATSGICPPLIARQGNTQSYNWNFSGGNQGTIPINSGAVSMQVGSNTMTGTTQTITFPFPYAQGNAIVLITPYTAPGSNPLWVSGISQTTFTVTGATGAQFEWMSIGI
jgi:hypothetical protein